MSKSKPGKSRIPRPDQQDQPAPADPGHQHSSSGGSGSDGGGSLTAAALSGPSYLSITPQVAQIIDTAKWSKPGPDPSGLAFIPGGTPGTGTLLECDSEVDEAPFNRPDNLFALS